MFRFLCCLFLFAMLPTLVWAQSARVDVDWTKIPTRELRVPSGALPVLLSRPNERVVMTRSEYEELLLKANISPSLISDALERVQRENEIPLGTITTDSQHKIVLQTRRVSIDSTYRIDILKKGWHAIPLELRSVQLLEATLDGKPALLGPVPEGSGIPGAILLCEGVGVHELRLRCAAIANEESVQQSISMVLPESLAAQWSLQAEGDVEILQGVDVAARTENADTKTTTFEIVPPRSAENPRANHLNLTMTLNNRTVNEESLFDVRMTQAVTLTPTTESSWTQFDLKVHHGSVNRIEFEIPTGYEVLKVQSPLLARWGLEAPEGADRPMGKWLAIEFREAVTEETNIVVVATNTESHKHPLPLSWQSPKWNVPKADQQQSILGVYLSEEIRWQDIKIGSMIPIQPLAVTAAIERDPRVAKETRLVSLLYDPVSSQVATATVDRTTVIPSLHENWALVADESQLRLRGVIEIANRLGVIETLEFEIPSAWRVERVLTSDLQPLPWNKRPGKDANTEIVTARINPAIGSGQSRELVVELASTPEGWLSVWDQKTVAMPRVIWSGLNANKTILSMEVRGDFTLEEQQTKGLEPVFLSERSALKVLADPANSLAFVGVSNDWNLEALVTRKQPRITAEALQFVNSTSSGHTVRHEIHVTPDQASIEEFRFSLKESTPSEIMIRATQGAVIRGYTSQVVEGRRIWDVKLQGKVTKPFRLTAEYRLPLTTDELLVPIARVENALFQSGLVALDRDESLDVVIKTNLRRADVGELIDSESKLGANFLGVFGYARFESEEPTIGITCQERELKALPATIVEKLAVRTWLSNQKWCFHQADLQLKTAVNRIAFLIPEGAELWSVSVDGLPALPQRHRESIIVELPEQPIAPMPSQGNANQAPRVESTTRSLSVAYASPLPPISLRKDLFLDYPRVVQASGNGMVMLPVVDIEWTVRTPYDIVVSSSRAGVTPVSRKLSNSFPYNLLLTIRDTTRELRRSSKDTASLASMAKEAVQQMVDRSDDTLPSQGQPTSPKPATESDPFDDRDPTPVFQESFPRRSAQPGMLPNPSKSAKSESQVRQQMDATRSLALRLSEDQQWSSSVWIGYGDDKPVHLAIHSLERWYWLARGIAVAIVAAGLLCWRRGARTFLRWGILAIAASIVIAVVVPHAHGVGILCEYAFWATAVVVGIRMVASVCEAVLRIVRNWGSQKRALATELTSILLLSALTGGALGQTVPPPMAVESILERLRSELSTDSTSVTIPSNAIVVPYTTGGTKWESGEDSRKNEKLLIPYSTYTYLKSLLDAEPTKAPPLRAISFGTMNYRANLAEDSSIELIGAVKITHHGQQTELVPFALSNGVLTKAEVNGKSASLHSAPHGFLVALAPSSEPYEFTFTVLIKSTSEAGWKRIRASIPNAPATQIDLKVPVASTEVRLSSGESRTSRMIQTNDEVIQEGLTSHQIDFQWRPKVTQIEQDRSLNAEVTTVATVTETGLGLRTDLQFFFRQGQREDFVVEWPKSVRVERVTGSNVKAWDLVESNVDGKQRIRVSLLKAASEREQIHLAASTPKRLGIEQEERLSLPVLTIPEAVNTRGSLSLAASSQLNVTIAASTGLVREDVRTDAPQGAFPLGLRPIAAFRHPRSEFGLDLVIQPIPLEMDASSTHIVSLTRSELRIESTIKASIRSGQVDGIDWQVPSGWEWEILSSSTPSELETAAPQGTNQRLRVQLASPIANQLQVRLRAKQKRDPSQPLDGSTLAIPSFQVLGASNDSGVVVFHVDRGIDAVLRESTQCTQYSIGSDVPSADGLVPKLGVRYQLRKANESRTYSGAINLRALKPIVDAVAVSNVKMTKHSMEQTVYIEWAIRNAGISEVSFVLPSGMRDAKLAAPLVRRVTKQPIIEQVDAPIRFRVELQDQVLGEYRVLLQHDRPWTPEPGQIPIASEITGSVRHRFVTLENAGFDELVVDESVGMSALMRGDTYWNEFQSILGSPSVQAFRINDALDGSLLDAADAGPRLAYRSKSRAALETVNARIGLAKTELSVDEFGRYRGMLEIRMENFSEPFLELELPPQCDLWTALVSEQSVKPGVSPNLPTSANGSRVRIPLIRTQKGDLDYPIRLGYAGRMAPLSTMSRLDLPFLKTINIQADRSQLVLRLPENHHWYGFEGTLGQVASESDLMASWLSFRNKQIRQLKDVVAAKTNDQFSQGRALENVKRLGDDIRSEIRSKGASASDNRKFQEELLWNESALRELKKDEDEFNRQSLTTDVDNRDRLGQRFSLQCNERAVGNGLIFEENAKSQAKQMVDRSKSGSSNSAANSPNSSPQQALQQQLKNGNRKGDDVNQLAQRYRGRIQSESAQRGMANDQSQASPFYQRTILGDAYGDANTINPPFGAPALGGPGYGTPEQGAGMGMGMGGAPGSGAPASGGMGGGPGGMGGGGMGGMGPGMGSVQGGYGNPPSEPMGGTNAQYMPTGRRSVNATMPMRGREYLFETPKGEMQLAARGVNSQALNRLIVGFVTLAIAALVWIVAKKRPS
jgi:hypothetical protein